MSESRGENSPKPIHDAWKYSADQLLVQPQYAKKPEKPSTPLADTSQAAQDLRSSAELVDVQAGTVAPDTLASKPETAGDSHRSIMHGAISPDSLVVSTRPNPFKKAN